MSGIFNASIFNNSIFNTGAAGPTPIVEEVVKTGTGGITKPFPIRRKTLHLKKQNIELKERLGKQIEDEIQITRRLSEEFTSEVPRGHFPEMSLLEIESEISMLMNKKIRSEEEDVLLLMLVAVAGNV